MTITIAVPAHNEARHLEKNIHTLHRTCVKLFGSADWCIVIAENGSTDETAVCATRLSQQFSNIIVRTSTIPGKGCAIQDAWNAHPADVFVFLDADLSTDPDNLSVLLKATTGADVVIGSRIHPESQTTRSKSRRLLSLAYNILARLFIGLTHQDHQCGFKAIRSEAWKRLQPHLREDGFLFDTELLALSHLLGLHVKEIPIHWEEERTHGRKSKVKFLKSACLMLFGLYRLRRRLKRILIQ